MPVTQARLVEETGGRKLPRSSVASILLLFALLVTTPALGDVFYVQGGGVDDAVVCTAPDCATQTFTLFAPAEAFGTLELDTATVPPTLSFDVTLWDQFLGLETVSGMEDNGVAAIDLLTDLVYSAAGLPLTETSPGSFSVDPGASALVEGDQVQWDDADVAVNGTRRSSASRTSRCRAAATSRSRAARAAA